MGRRQARLSRADLHGAQGRPVEDGAQLTDGSPVATVDAELDVL